MNIKIFKDLTLAIGAGKLKAYGIEKERITWEKFHSIDLNEFKDDKIAALHALILPFSAGREKLFSAPQAIKDIETWQRIKKTGHFSDTKARTVEQFHDLLKAHLYRTPGHRIFKQDKKRGVRLCYYVGETEYKPKVVHKDSTTPPHTIMDLFWIEFGGRQHKKVIFWDEDCLGRSVNEILMDNGYMTEDEILRSEYLLEVERFHKEVGQIGKQFLAKGVATDDLDGNSKNRHSERWWSSQTQLIRLDHDDEPAQIVVDVFRESDKEDSDRDAHFSRYFWDRPVWLGVKGDSDRDDWQECRDEAEATEVEGEDEEKIEIPLHPMLATFDLRRHVRLRVHISQMEEYVYDDRLGDKLVLPKEHQELIEILLDNKGGFKDIIKGKSGGAVILCAGDPGTGKTLTSEVYAEVAARPLYSVQCSQLGTEPDELEEELLKTFARAQRWNAILLLDEADVYVKRRGDDLQQNAIVGVFLRTLEYYKGVMFLTTNRADLVDDAIASRCVARIDYEIPSLPDQKRIWRILATNSNCELSDAEIEKITTKHSVLSGRDIKNLLKLALMVAVTRKTAVTSELISFVKKFKPTMAASEVGK